MSVDQVLVRAAGGPRQVRLALPAEAILEVRCEADPPDPGLLFVLPVRATGAGHLAGPRSAPVRPGLLPGRRTETSWVDEIPDERVFGARIERSYLAQPDPTGVARLRGLAPGTYHLLWKTDGPGNPEILSRTVVLDEGFQRVQLTRVETGALRIEAGPRASLEETGPDESLGLIPGTHRGHLVSFPVRDLGELPAPGSFRLVTGIPPGRHRILLGRDPAIAVQTVQVTARRTTHVRFEEASPRTTVVRSEEHLLGRQRGVSERWLTLSDDETLVEWPRGTPGTLVAWSRDGGRVDRVDLTAEHAVAVHPEPPALLRGEIVDRDGRPVGPGAHVTLALADREPSLDFSEVAPLPTFACAHHVAPRRPDGCDPPVVRTDADGEFGPIRLSPGRWEIAVPGGQTVRRRLHHRDHRFVRLQIRP